ncbi:hypothetical protein [Maribacter arcticus]|uniref:Uncharacterized protein n=1 Tax=Maribacter arcticus TaxID=561365 RepID=A0A1T5ECF9_9FLAO|nr:hypothetical protein [Maribacter arcticus]SKB81702.1 hypothetical protein SAMN05660866_03429 [Maribacter arcticus]
METMKQKNFEIKPYQRLLKQIKFENVRSQYTDREIQMELLYSNSLLFEQLQLTQKNTNIIKIIVLIFAILSVLIGLLIGLGII